eukprot:GSA25T00007042001.1
MILIGDLIIHMMNLEIVRSLKILFLGSRNCFEMNSGTY